MDNKLHKNLPKFEYLMDRKFIDLGFQYLKNVKYGIGEKPSNKEIGFYLFINDLFNYHSEDISELFFDFMNIHLQGSTSVPVKDLIRYENSSRFAIIKLPIPETSSNPYNESNIVGEL